MDELHRRVHELVDEVAIRRKDGHVQVLCQAAAAAIKLRVRGPQVGERGGVERLRVAVAYQLRLVF